MNRFESDRAYTPAIFGVFLLVLGFVFDLNVYSNHGPLYVLSIHAYNWTLRVGGLLLLVTAGLCAPGWRIGPLLYFVVSATAGVILLACVVTWIAFERGLDLFTIITLLIAGSLIRNGYSGWVFWRVTAVEGADRAPSVPVDATPSVRISSDVLPSADESPPPEGYLAALAKEHREQRKTD